MKILWKNIEVHTPPLLSLEHWFLQHFSSLILNMLNLASTWTQRRNAILFSFQSTRIVTCIEDYLPNRIRRVLGPWFLKSVSTENIIADLSLENDSSISISITSFQNACEGLAWNQSNQGKYYLKSLSNSLSKRLLHLGTDRLTDLIFFLWKSARKIVRYFRISFELQSSIRVVSIIAFC